MIDRNLLDDFIRQSLGEDLLSKAATKDQLCNGLQFRGRGEVKKIATGVSLNQEFLKQALQWGADTCIFHHGLDMRQHNSIFPVYTQDRLRTIFQNDLNIYAFHYALDAHPRLGNNAQIIEKLGGEIVDTLYDEWGFVAEFKESKSREQLQDQIKQIFDKALFFDSNKTEINRIGVVSGGAKPYHLEIQEMLDKNVDLYLSGESSESAPHKLLEVDINYYLCGHYATEVFGVQALGDSIQSHFNGELEVKFIDVYNPL